MSSTGRSKVTSTGKQTQKHIAPDSPLEKLFLIEDEPVPDHLRDELGLQPFSRIVAGAAVGTDGPFTIGVFADWGQGKTSVLRQAQSLINHSFEEVVTVWFNAWQYEREDHPIVPLVASIIQAVEAKREAAEKSAALATKIGDATLKGMGMLSRGLRALAYGFSSSARVKVPGFGEVEAGFVAKEMIDRYEKLSAKTTDDPLLMRSLYYDAFNMLDRVGREEGGAKVAQPRIVVFVDDLDRCMPDQAVKLLESIKLVLCQPGFVFALAVDKRIIESYLTKRYKEQYGVDRYSEGSSYLDKMVQLPLQLPPHKGRFEKYVADLIVKRLEGRDQDAAVTLEPLANLLAIGANYTPRSLVRLVNNLLVDQRLRKLTAPDDDSMNPKEFLGLCAVSRSLQQSLDNEAYQLLVTDQNTCNIILDGKRIGIIELLDRSERLTSLEAPNEPDAVEEAARRLHDKITGGPIIREEMARRIRSSGGQRHQRLLRALADKEHLDELFGHKMGKLWLGDQEKRAAVNEFLSTQREQPSEVSQDQVDLINHAIRNSLGLWKDAPITEALRARVTRLDLPDEGITDAGLTHLKALPNLQSLDLSGTKITGAGLAHLNVLPGLQSLDLSGTQINDAGLANLGALTGLQSLSLSGTQITDAGLAHLEVLTGLQTLYLGFTQITDVGLEHLKSLKGLHSLYLWKTMIKDEGLTRLLMLPELQSLDLRGTQVNKKAIEELKRAMPRLEVHW